MASGTGRERVEAETEGPTPPAAARGVDAAEPIADPGSAVRVGGAGDAPAPEESTDAVPTDPGTVEVPVAAGEEPDAEEQTGPGSTGVVEAADEPAEDVVDTQ